MSQSHLKELRSALTEHGWTIVAERLRGDEDVQGAATWQVTRDGGPVVMIDFAGFGGMGEDISLDQSYACQVRGRSEIGLYFRRIDRSRTLWLRDLAAFTEALDTDIDT
jgi:hypothetical protein